MIEYLKSLFKSNDNQELTPGARVNYCPGGSIMQTDGVLLCLRWGQALVEWPRGGSDWVDAGALVAQIDQESRFE